MTAETNVYLAPTDIIDSESGLVVQTAKEAVKNAGPSAVSKAVRLYYTVRDRIWYDPYLPFYRPEHYRASHVIQAGRAFCIGKAALLCALGRACGIPSRLGYADVRNHLATRELIAYLGSDIFVFHGYTEMYLEDKWVKATPAFNKELCQKHNVSPLEFNGREDSVFQSYSREKKRFMQYLKDRGSYTDVPVDEIVAAMRTTYGNDRVERWIAAFETAGGKTRRNFAAEAIYKP